MSTPSCKFCGSTNVRATLLHGWCQAIALCLECRASGPVVDFTGSYAKTAAASAKAKARRLWSHDIPRGDAVRKASWAPYPEFRLCPSCGDVGRIFFHTECDTSTQVECGGCGTLGPKFYGNPRDYLEEDTAEHLSRRHAEALRLWNGVEEVMASSGISKHLLKLVD